MTMKTFYSVDVEQLTSYWEYNNLPLNVKIKELVVTFRKKIEQFLLHISGSTEEMVNNTKSDLPK